MKQLMNMQIIGIDHGYGNLKTASGIFPASVLTFDHEPAYAQDLLIYDGKYHVIGSGHREFTTGQGQRPGSLYSDPRLHRAVQPARRPLRQLHAERGLSYSALIVPAVNAHYGKAATDESLRETIRSIVREELVTAPVQLGDLLQALKTAVPEEHLASPSAHNDEPDEDDLDDALDSFGC